MHYDLTPRAAVPSTTRASSRSSASRSSAAAAARRPSTSRCSSSELPRASSRRRARAGLRARAARRSTATCRYDQAPSFLVVGERTNANGSKKFREAMLDGDWDTTVAMAGEQVTRGQPRHRRVRRLRRPRRHRRHGRGRQPVRHAVDRAAHGRLHRARRRRDGAPVDRRQGHPQLGQPRGRRRARHPSRPVPLARRASTAPPSSRTCIDEAGPGPRPREWKVRAARAIHDIAVDRYGLAPHDLFFDPLALTLATGIEESRRDGIETIEGIRRIKAELPGVNTILGLSNDQLRPQPGGPPGAELGVPARVPGGRPRRRHRPRRPHRADQPAPRGAGRGLPRPHLRPARASGYDPLHRLMELFEGAAATRRREGGPHRLDRSSSASSSASSTATATASTDDLDEAMAGGLRAAGHHQRRPPRRHEDRRRAVRLRPDAAAVRAPVGRDDEGGGRPPRAAHGEGRRRLVEGPHRARHREGRRPRHRQEPRRHHPHEQRLRGAQPRHQGVARRDDREGARDRGRRHRDERPAREVDAHHAGEPRGAERPRPRRASRCCSAAPRSPASYVERDLRGVYEGRVFYGKDAFEGLVGDGQARRHQAGRRARRPGLGARAVGVAGAGAVPARAGRDADGGGVEPAYRPGRPTSPTTTRSSCRRSSGRGS